MNSRWICALVETCRACDPRPQTQAVNASQDGVTMNRSSKLLLSILAAAVVAALVAGGSSAASASVGAARDLHLCATFTGPAWKVRQETRTATGKAYEVSAVRGVSCAFAKAWALKFVRTRIVVPQAGAPRLRGPAGWDCYANVAFSRAWAWSGSCGKGGAFSDVKFSWGPKQTV